LKAKAAVAEVPRAAKPKPLAEGKAILAHSFSDAPADSGRVETIVTPAELA